MDWIEIGLNPVTSYVPVGAMEILWTNFRVAINSHFHKMTDWKLPTSYSLS